MRFCCAPEAELNGYSANDQDRRETMLNKQKNHAPEEIKKPFLTGSIFDERTIRSSLGFFGTLIIVFLVAFIACASASFGNFILRLLFNAAAIILALIIFYNSGTKRGADDVARGEILWQKKEKQIQFSHSEQKLCFHQMKGYLIGLIGSGVFILLAIYLALNTSISMTGSGTLPSWMQAYAKRSDIGNALVNYTQPEGMMTIDYIRAIVRVAIIPFVNIIGTANREGILIIERLSPLILLLPAAAYGTGYLGGKTIRTRIHTAISDNERKRARKEKKRRKGKPTATHSREPEQLN